MQCVALTDERKDVYDYSDDGDQHADGIQYSRAAQAPDADRQYAGYAHHPRDSLGYQLEVIQDRRADDEDEKRDQQVGKVIVLHFIPREPVLPGDIYGFITHSVPSRDITGSRRTGDLLQAIGSLFLLAVFLIVQFFGLPDPVIMFDPAFEFF